ncbi:MAG: hypothetical protein ACI9HK_001045 [Pirellulaceae bacterium]|jgi:hypothetical protein
MAKKRLLVVATFLALALTAFVAKRVFASEETGLGEMKIERALDGYDVRTHGFYGSNSLPAGLRGIAPRWGLPQAGQLQQLGQPQLQPPPLRGDFFRIERGMKADAILRNPPILRR